MSGGNQVVRNRNGCLVALSFVLALCGCGTSVVTSPSGEPEPSASDEPVPSASMLPDLGLPGMSPYEPGGEYGWTGAPGSSAGLHKVVEASAGGFRQTQLTFAVADDCFAYGTDGETVPVTVAGLDGLYFEPYEDPDVLFYSRGLRTDETTGAYALPIGDRTLCVYLTWDPDTTQDELEEARQVVESIRAQPLGTDLQGGIRINFTLPARWDTG